MPDVFPNGFINYLCGLGNQCTIVCRHAVEPGGGGKTTFPAPDHQGRDRQLQGRVCQDDGVRREDHCRKLHITSQGHKTIYLMSYRTY